MQWSALKCWGESVWVKHIAGQKWESRQWGKGLHPGRCKAARVSYTLQKERGKKDKSRSSLWIFTQGFFYKSILFMQWPCPRVPFLDEASIISSFCDKKYYAIVHTQFYPLCSPTFCAVLPKEDNRTCQGTEESDWGQKAKSAFQTNYSLDTDAWKRQMGAIH